MADSKHTTDSGHVAIVLHPTNDNPPTNGGQTAETPQTYDEWKQRHGYQPDTERFLEIGQRGKATRDIDDSEDADDSYYEWQSMHGTAVEPPVFPVAYVDEDTLGTVTALHYIERHTYEITFDNGVVFWCAWWDEYDDDETWEIVPVGKSPSEQRAEQAERERLAGFKQLSLFEAVSNG